MRMSNILPIIVFGMVLTATAGPPPQSPTASNTVETNAVPAKLASLQPAPKGKGEIQRVGKMSSRPWPEIVGWRPGVSQFPDAENHESQLVLLSVGFGPQHRPPRAISGQ